MLLDYHIHYMLSNFKLVCVRAGGGEGRGGEGRGGKVVLAIEKYFINFFFFKVNHVFPYSNYNF